MSCQSGALGGAALCFAEGAENNDSGPKISPHIAPDAAPDTGVATDAALDAGVAPDATKDAPPDAVPDAQDSWGDARPPRGGARGGRNRSLGAYPRRFRSDGRDVGINRLRGGKENRVYVSRLDYDVNEEELEEFFSKFGRVKSGQIIRKPGVFGRRCLSKGFGFVVFEDEAGVKAALAAADEDLVLRGRQARVEIARGFDKIKALSEGIADDVAEGSSLEGLKLEDSDDGEDSAPSPGDFLPDLVLLRVFSLLDLRERVRLERVCQRWRRLSRDSWSLLTSFVLPDFPAFYSFGSAINDFTFVGLLKRMRGWKTNKTGLRHLDISRSGLRHHALKAIGDLCPKLEKLDISGAQMTLDAIRHISGGCKGLKRLIIRDGLDLQEKAAWYFLKDCRELESLDLRGCSRIVGNFFHLANEKLVELNLERCNKLKDDSVKKIVEKCPDLKVVNLSNCVGLSVDGFLHLSRLCHLRVLKLSQMNMIPEVSLAPLFNADTELNDLDLSQNRCVDAQILRQILDHCVMLKRLNLSCCYSLNNTHFFSESCIGKLPRLQYLNLGYIRLPDDFYFPVVYPELETLVLTATPGIDDDKLIKVVAGCPALNYLDISGDYGVTDKFVWRWFGIGSEPVPINKRRREAPLDIKAGGSEISHAVDSDATKPWKFLWFDGSIFSLRQDQNMVARYDDFESDFEDDDYDSPASFGDGDLCEDEMEEFERNWVS